MIYPIVRYGRDILRSQSVDINLNYPNLNNIIKHMWDTMYNACGVGLAAPQVNIPIKLFIVDTIQIFNEEKKASYPNDTPIKQVFINPKIIAESEASWSYEEGCLSIPDIKTNVVRPKQLVLEYLDENFQKKTGTFTDITARVIFHEYDHLIGKLFIDRISSLKKKLISSKLKEIVKGNISVRYKIN